MENNTGQVLTTKNGNLLVQVKGSNGGFVYMSPEGVYLPNIYEETNGKAIDHREWNFMKERVGDTRRNATDTEIEMALRAIEKRKEMLKLDDVLDRIEWKDINVPVQKKPDLSVSADVVLVDPETTPNTPFANLLKN